MMRVTIQARIGNGPWGTRSRCEDINQNHKLVFEDKIGAARHVASTWQRNYPQYGAQLRVHVSD